MSHLSIFSVVIIIALSFSVCTRPLPASPCRPLQITPILVVCKLIVYQNSRRASRFQGSSFLDARARISLSARLMRASHLARKAEITAKKNAQASKQQKARASTETHANRNAGKRYKIESNMIFFRHGLLQNKPSAPARASRNHAISMVRSFFLPASRFFPHFSTALPPNDPQFLFSLFCCAFSAFRRQDRRASRPAPSPPMGP